MRRIEHLIRQVRRQTDNVQIGSDDGISDEELLEYFNNAQEDIQTHIFKLHRHIFHKDYTFPVVRLQDSYDFPSYVFLDSSQVVVEYSGTNDDADYRPLDFTTRIERRSVRSDPLEYTLRRNQIILSPMPSASTGRVRLTYNYVVPRLDKRRTTVLSTTVAGGAITALQLDSADPLFLLDDWLEDDYLCLVDPSGNQLTRAIQYSAIDAAGNITLEGGSHTLETGETATIGDYVVRGKNATTNSELNDIAEKFLIQYCAHRVLHRDESDAIAKQDAILSQMRADIVSSYAVISGDHHQIPLLTYEYF